MDRERILAFLSLFSSASTLVCCALPALFVALGAGATLAGLVSNLPWLVFLTEHKAAVFALAGLLLALAGYLQWKNRHAPCPVDPVLAGACMRLRGISRIILVFSALIYIIGFAFAYVLVYFV
jgi:hypothetical protein